MFLFPQQEQWPNVVCCSMQQHQITQPSKKLKVFFSLVPCSKVKTYSKLQSISHQRERKQ